MNSAQLTKKTHQSPLLKVNIIKTKTKIESEK